ncbi:polysaccharide deacetylase family protein [Pedobacter miscanthi]|uniref:polysaccharide deacetylase family protein n=1 Tax=Pedobacter miscanthi TaxID=2259170 RepID=UPI001FC9145B|nr:polysaccharide deacetylase family protein [Pedobacter miscanthi]
MPQKITLKPIVAKSFSASEIIAKKEVPVLCYHHIRNWRRKDSKRDRNDIISMSKFEKHLKMLSDSGYHSILPDELYDYLTLDRKLPEKPVMISFDDGYREQFTIAAPLLKKYGFKGVFFVTTDAIGGRRMLKKKHIRNLSDQGHIIANHTFQHLNLANLSDSALRIQVIRSAKKLKEITGKEVKYLAYPYGIYSENILLKLKEMGIRAAFILSTKRSAKYPLYTIRRIIDPGNYTAKNLYHSIHKSFK